MKEKLGLLVLCAALVLTSAPATAQQAELGASVTARPAVDVSCGTSSTVALPKRDRKMVAVCNLSDADVYYAWGAAAVTAAPSHILTSKSCHLFDAKVPVDALACVSSAGGKHISVQDFK